MTVSRTPPRRWPGPGEIRSSGKASSGSGEFAETVARIGIPGVNSAVIAPKKYHPVINGGVFSKNNQLADGITTVALRNP